MREKRYRVQVLLARQPYTGKTGAKIYSVYDTVEKKIVDRQETYKDAAVMEDVLNTTNAHGWEPILTKGEIV